MNDSAIGIIIISVCTIAAILLVLFAPKVSDIAEWYKERRYNKIHAAREARRKENVANETISRPVTAITEKRNEVKKWSELIGGN